VPWCRVGVNLGRRVVDRTRRQLPPVRARGPRTREERRGEERRGEEKKVEDVNKNKKKNKEAQRPP
jgi:hypothetical protein